ncbi:MAG: diguanylate cyclase [Janthinobacterium lividum]
MQAADTVLVGLRHDVETSGLAPEKLAALRAYMAVSIATLPTLHGLFVYDANGSWIVNSASNAPRTLTNFDRDYFRYHRSNPDRGVHIGLPVHSKSDGSWIITVSRRIDAPDGSFAGLVVATISIDAMQKFYGQFGVGAQGAISLFSLEGVLIARNPVVESLIGTDVSSGKLFRTIAQRSSGAGSLQYVASLDRVTRLGSYRLVEDYPLVIVVAHGLEDALADWRADAQYHSAIVFGVAAVLALLGQRFARQVRRGQQAERRYRLLAEHSSDAIVCVAMSGKRLYVSPAFGQMTGWSDAESAAKRWAYFVHPDDRKAVREIGQQLSSGIGQAVATYRYLCKDGSHLWVEASFVLLPAADGEPTQFVANIRDITARKLAEDRLAAASEELARQASSDGLTGIANRRRLDEALDLEWRRAARDLQPLSLLMIDVDCFKVYNDSHGHQQGDHVLRAVATAIAGSVQRPGDLVARYGGEEFAVLLADTDVFGASEVAEKMRAAIEDLGIEHSGNLSAGCVTASIGIATTYPEHQGLEVSQETLVAAADTALYGAKRAGRNRALAAASPVPVLQGRDDAVHDHFSFGAKKVT